MHEKRKFASPLILILYGSSNTYKSPTVDIRVTRMWPSSRTKLLLRRAKEINLKNVNTIETSEVSENRLHYIIIG